MTTLTSDELSQILADHKVWLDTGGQSGKMADLCGGDLRRANLYRADLSGADLSGADLSRADLSEANLSEANLRRAFLEDVENLSPQKAAELEILPRRGEIYGWKKCRDDVLVEIVVPDGVPRSNATGRKCRAKSVRVVHVHGSDSGISLYDSNIRYVEGETVSCDSWQEDRWQECGGGIHFFLTREEAEDFTM